jgi:hypothetical protein
MLLKRCFQWRLEISGTDANLHNAATERDSVCSVLIHHYGSFDARLQCENRTTCNLVFLVLLNRRGCHSYSYISKRKANSSTGNHNMKFRETNVMT